jgi:hypothetical protein
MIAPSIGEVWSISVRLDIIAAARDVYGMHDCQSMARTSMA